MDNLFCPFCGGVVRIEPCDDEGNYPKGPEYEENPWSGLGYIICHAKSDADGECPIAKSDGEEMMGRFIYDTREEAAEAWKFKRRD